MGGTVTPFSIGVVIRSLNEEQHVGRLLTGIARQTTTPSEVVLVDSGSTDATVDIAQRFGVSVRSIAPDVFSFGRSLNLGCAALNTDVVVVASAHVYPTHNTWLEHLVAPFANERVALSYGRQIGDERTRYAEHRLLSRWFPSQSVANQMNPFCNNANAAIRRNIWQDLPYDEDLTGLEDLDWARRVIDKGYLLAYVAEASIVHVHEETWARLRNRYRREAIAHRRIYKDQRMSAVEAVRLGLGHIVADYRSAASDKVLLKNLLSIPGFHLAQFLGAYEGFSQEGDASSELKRRFYYPHAGSRPDLGDHERGSLIDYSAHKTPALTGSDDASIPVQRKPL